MTGRKRALVITADDFGMHAAVNRAVERAHREGVLSAASLMMHAPASEEAVDIARRTPSLRVGLHIMVADGWASSPVEDIPGIAAHNGVMDARVIARSFRFLRPAVARQLRREIAAQFAAFRQTGLRLDHVNVHKHLHMHPVVLRTLLDVAGAEGCPSLRIPWEPSWVARSQGAAARAGNALLNGWARLARRVAQRAGMTCNDAVFGITHTGRVTEALLLRIVDGLPLGLSEIYLHPADTSTPLNPQMSGYRPGDELRALLSPAVRGAIERSGVPLGGYGTP